MHFPFCLKVKIMIALLKTSDENEFHFMTLQISNNGLTVLFVVVNSDTKVMETVCWLGVRSSQWPQNRSKPGAQRINSTIILTNNHCAWKHFKMSPHLVKEVTCMTDLEWFHPVRCLRGHPGYDLKEEVEQASTRVSNTTIKPPGPNSSRSVLTK